MKWYRTAENFFSMHFFKKEIDKMQCSMTLDTSPYSVRIFCILFIISQHILITINKAARACKFLSYCDICRAMNYHQEGRNGKDAPLGTQRPESTPKSKYASKTRSEAYLPQSIYRFLLRTEREIMMSW